jgi:pilus assembly protein CpaB
MNRQSRTLIVLLVALGAAAIASFGVYRAISSIPERRVEIATKHAVVAARALPMGARLTADNVKVVGWPERTPLAGGFSSIEEVVDRGLISAVVENEPISESKLAPKEAGAGLPPSIPAGMRAMSVRVNEVIGVAGFVVPGTHVDVMAVLKGQKSDGLARVVVSNVQVLTAGTRYDQENVRKDGKPIPSSVVTLMVSPNDAERIALAQAEGQLMLSLRNPLDTEPTASSGARTAALFSTNTPVSSPPEASRDSRPRPRPVVEPPPPPPAPPKAYTVEAIRAAKKTEEVVKEENVP